MQYQIGPATFGHPIVWKREAPHMAWTGAEDQMPHNYQPDDVVNWKDFVFAESLVNNIHVGDFLFLGYSGLHQSGWVRVDRYNPQSWCFQSGYDSAIPLLDVFARYSVMDDAFSFSESVTTADVLIWDLVLRGVTR